jgi:nicotinamidase-related amidase
MNNTVLLVVDVQKVLIDEHPYNEQKVIENIKNLISFARAKDIEVIYVRHDDGAGTELDAGSDGWQIYEEISPTTTEKIFDKQYNSAFLKTGLKEYLDSKEITTIILTGLQTEYCIDTTCKCAFEYGYKIIIPEETNSTYDNDYLSGEKLYHYYNFTMWNKRFANVLPVIEVIRRLEDN